MIGTELLRWFTNLAAQVESDARDLRTIEMISWGREERNLNFQIVVDIEEGVL